MAPRGGSFVGHLLVSICACVLTVSIVGSALFLVWRVIERRELRSKVQAFVSSLENRTSQELADRAADLKAYPKVARHILPEIVRTIRSDKSEGRQRAAIEISKAFLDKESIIKTLFELRRDPRESIAAAAVQVLSELQPVSRAADLMGQCAVDAKTASACDEACAALFRLGDAGLAEARRRVSSLSPGRRRWIVAYAAAHPGPQQGDWLLLMSQDAEQSIRSAALEALTGAGGESGISESPQHPGGAAAGEKVAGHAD